MELGIEIVAGTRDRARDRDRDSGIGILRIHGGG